MNKKTSALGLAAVLLVLGLGKLLGFDALALINALNQAQVTSQAPTPKSPAEPSKQVAQQSAAAPAPTKADRRQVCGTYVDIDTPVEDKLEAWGKQLRLGNLEAFANVLQYINQTGDLPDCYLTKAEAEAWGWQRGSDLWRVAEGMAIGGNQFQNREGLLPRRYNGRYVEADLDYDGQRRDARRIVFVKDAGGQWLIWITLDHYESFLRVSP